MRIEKKNYYEYYEGREKEFKKFLIFDKPNTQFEIKINPEKHLYKIKELKKGKL